MYAKAKKRRGQLDDHELDGSTISRILVETVWDLVQTKCSLCRRLEKRGDLILSCCYRNRLKKVGEEKDLHT